MKDQFTPTEDTVSVTDGLARPGPNAEKPYYDPTWNGDGDLTESEGDTLAHGLLDAHVVEAEILGSDDGCSLGTKSVHTYYEATFAELLNFMYMGGARISDFTFW
ncbi:hypothetical protein N7499_004971 [Penicillium canescens]|uniref:Uncharacterized protein n=1 Tax=Penicillium canescens TaxID=5083 RepID=A0AAD6I127_PENCN|nr:hypothetical protein N7460_011684 [Penicillium canescens]KAJ6085342.1 hypothetical protein N7499_004971 [Penicillium canescens]KAJ6162122.1 hypothetical protein N7485_010352 [Penicillium canescens]